MKKVLFVTVTAMLMASCFYNSESGSGNIKKEKRNVTAFTGIHASSSVDVEVKTGSPSVEVEADDNIIEFVKTKLEGNVLHIGIVSGASISNAHIKVYVTVPELTLVEASSSASIKVLDVIKSNSKVSFDAGSSADIEAEVDAPEVYAEAGSSGTVTLSGRTKNYKAEAGSSGSIKSAELMSENTDVTAGSSGTAEVHASVTLNANASSSGTVEYTGGAQVTSNTNSAGTVRKKD